MRRRDVPERTRRHPNLIGESTASIAPTTVNTILIVIDGKMFDCQHSAPGARVSVRSGRGNPGRAERRVDKSRRTGHHEICEPGAVGTASRTVRLFTESDMVRYGTPISATWQMEVASGTTAGSRGQRQARRYALHVPAGLQGTRRWRDLPRLRQSREEMRCGDGQDAGRCVARGACDADWGRNAADAYGHCIRARTERSLSAIYYSKYLSSDSAKRNCRSRPQSTNCISRARN